MNVDERLSRRRNVEQRVAPGRNLAEPPADREDDVCVLQACGERVVHGDAEHAGVARGVVVDEVLAAERARDRQRVRLAEGQHVVARLLRPAALADDDERPFGSPENLAQLGEVALARGGPPDSHGRAVVGVGQLCEDVLRKREHHGAGPAREGERERACDVLGDAGGAVHVPGGLGDPAEHARVVQLLPRLATLDSSRNMAREEDHRRRVLPRGVDADGRLGRSGTSRHEADSRAAR